MRIVLAAVGKRMPGWVERGFEQYAKRMPAHCRLELREVAAEPRGKNADLSRVMEIEGAGLLDCVPADAMLIALDRRGKSVSTEELAEFMQQWWLDGRDVVFLVGGAEGLAPKCKQRADRVWSLSAMTFAHPLVRIVLAEQLYRASSILANHPYHRG